MECKQKRHVSLPDQSFSESSSAFSIPLPLQQCGYHWWWNPREQQNHNTEESCNSKSLHGGELVTDHEQQIHSTASGMKNNYIFYVWAFVFCFVIFLVNSYWSIVALQGCIHFCCTEKWIWYTDTYIFSFLDYFPVYVITEYCIEFPKAIR